MKAEYKIKEELKYIVKSGEDIKNQIEKLEAKYHRLQVEAVKTLLNSFVIKKDFVEMVMVFRGYDENKPVWMHIEFFNNKLQEYCSLTNSELADFLDAHLPGYTYHFSIPINDFVEFVGSDFEHAFKFKEFDVEKIKEFAKEYNLKIRCGFKTVEECDEQIEEIKKQKNKALKFQKMFE